MSLPRPRRELLLPLFLIIGLGLLVAACSPSGIVPVGSGGVAATASPHPPLTPAQKMARFREIMGLPPEEPEWEDEPDGPIDPAIMI